MSIAKRLQELRQEMTNRGIDFYLVPSIDAHNSEYVPECWQRRPWISNFDGSAGEALIALDGAYLSTDGRYFLQAEQQLDSSLFKLIKQSGFVSETENWLSVNGGGKKLGLDPKVVGIGRFKQLQALMSKIGGELVVIEDNLIDSVKLSCGENVSIPTSDAMMWDVKYSGMSTDDKLSWLRGELKSKSVDYIALNVLDEIAWLFNLRGSDIDFNPFLISYALISNDTAILFTDKNKIKDPLLGSLQNSKVQIFDYTQIGDELSKLTGKILLDDTTASQWMLQQAEKSAEVTFAKSPIVLKKALKNPTEMDGMRISHRKDAVAMVNFLHWLDNNWQNNVDEISASDKLADFRGEQENIHGLSFSTISGYAANGAIIHYRATHETSKKISNDNLYLIDSGGQYLEGTTDITRTLHLGSPTEEQKRHYTLVLKGHLALSRAVFVEGTRGDQLDILARAPLWNEYLNYRHGTGHGVGCFMGVHEGPHRISQAPSLISLQHGMIVSNEPGLYITGEYGIRIENLCMVQKITDAKAELSEYGPFYKFEDLTLVPYCKKLIDFALLSQEDKQQIKRYYDDIRQFVLPKLASDVQIWLENELSIENL